MVPLQLQSFLCATEPQQLVLVQVFALSDRTLSQPLRASEAQNLFVVRAIALLTQTHPQRHHVDQLVSLRRSRSGTLSSNGQRLIARLSCGSPIVVKVEDPASHERHQND